MPYISESEYNLATKNKRFYYVSNDTCPLGKVNTFKVKGTDLSVRLRCCQHGGLWNGTHAYTNQLLETIEDIKKGYKFTSKENGVGIVTHKTKRTITVTFENGYVKKNVYRTNHDEFFISDF